MSVVHECPPDGTGVTPCCGLSPFEIPAGERITEDPSLVTCPDGPEPAPAGPVAAPPASPAAGVAPVDPQAETGPETGAQDREELVQRMCVTYVEAGGFTYAATGTGGNLLGVDGAAMAAVLGLLEAEGRLRPARTELPRYQPRDALTARIVDALMEAGDDRHRAAALLEVLKAEAHHCDPDQVDQLTRAIGVLTEFVAAGPGCPASEETQTCGDPCGDRSCTRPLGHAVHNDGHGTSWTHLGPADLHDRLRDEVGADTAVMVEHIIGDALGGGWPPPVDLYARRLRVDELEIVSTTGGLRATVVSEFPEGDENQDVIRWLLAVLPSKEAPGD